MFGWNHPEEKNEKLQKRRKMAKPIPCASEDAGCQRVRGDMPQSKQHSFSCQREEHSTEVWIKADVCICDQKMEKSLLDFLSGV